MLEFWPSFCQSFAIIFLSEIADRTFILEMVYAPKIGALSLLITSTLALGLMNVIAISVGYLLPLLLLREYVDWVGFAAFTLFGVYSIYDSLTMESETVSQKVEQEKTEKEKAYVAIQDAETGNSSALPEKKEDPGLIRKCAELFGLLCISEIGDKSEIATVTIAALYNVLGVLAGTMMAYTVTCCCALFLGSMLGSCITEKQMTLVGGIVFLLFALQILLSKLGYSFFF